MTAETGGVYSTVPLDKANVLGALAAITSSTLKQDFSEGILRPPVIGMTFSLSTTPTLLLSLHLPHSLGQKRTLQVLSDGEGVTPVELMPPISDGLEKHKDRTGRGRGVGEKKEENAETALSSTCIGREKTVR